MVEPTSVDRDFTERTSIKRGTGGRLVKSPRAYFKPGRPYDRVFVRDLEALGALRIFQILVAHSGQVRRRHLDRDG